MKMDVREAYFHVRGFVQGLILKQAENNSEIAIAYTDDANQFRKFATAGQEGHGLYEIVDSNEATSVSRMPRASCESYCSKIARI